MLKVVRSRSFLYESGVQSKTLSPSYEQRSKFKTSKKAGKVDTSNVQPLRTYRKHADFGPRV